MLTEKKKFIVGIAWGFGLFIIGNIYFKIHPFHSVKHHIVVNSHKPIGATYLPVSEQVFLQYKIINPPQYHPPPSFSWCVKSQAMIALIIFSFSWKCPILFKSTAKKLCGKFETNIPRNETARPLFQFLHSCTSSKIGRPILGIYISLTDTWMWEVGMRPCRFSSGHT